MIEAYFSKAGFLVTFLLIAGFYPSGKISVYQTGDSPLTSKPRVLILTDITSLKAGYLEPDDGQSLIRFMLYANQLQIEGLVASSNLRHGKSVRPELIHEVIDTYAKVQPNLILHDPSYPTANHLHPLVKSGQPEASPVIPATTSIGEGRDTEGSEWIIHVVDQPDARPVWVCVWGGSADLAQALWKIQRTRSMKALQVFVSKLRVHAVSDQDATGPWIREHFPNLFYILANHSYRGMYRGGNTGLNDSAWVADVVNKPGNPLGMLYPNYLGGDIWSGKLGRVKGVKEGDTPSFLRLIPNGLNIPDQPELGGWGGIFSKTVGKHLSDQVDSTGAFASDPTPYMASVYRWRNDWQNDFVARLQWCVKTYGEANHHPKVVVNGNATDKQTKQTVRRGKSIQFNADRSSDPDGQSLLFHWQIYPGSAIRGITLSGTDSKSLTVRADSTASIRNVPLLLTVTDTGKPALCQYRRVIVEVHK